jgi:hypothetical protein
MVPYAPPRRTPGGLDPETPTMSHQERRRQRMLKSLRYVAERLDDQFEADLVEKSAHLDYHALSYMVRGVVQELGGTEE